MLEQQGESDEDCEVYFLKPVNEYNIVEKIKEANKELFAEASPESKSNIGTQETSSVIKISTTTTTTTTTTIRKVTFAPNLEDYEPENASQNEIESSPHPTDNVDEIRVRSKSEIEKFPTLEEEEQLTTIQNETPQMPEVVEDIDEIITSKIEEEATTSLVTTDDVQNDCSKEDDVDEICEEIIVMEMDSNTTTTAVALLDDDSLISQQQRRLMLKQATFDYDEQDNKSLTNLLTVSDCEEEEDGVCENEDHDEDANDASIFSGIDDFDDDFDDEDDDKLSLIVASYLPDDFDRMPVLSSSPSAPNRTTTEMKSNTEKSLPQFRRGSGRTANANRNTSSSTFGRRFQLHRKSHSTNSIGTVGNAMAAKELPDLKLNYKTCCEYRNSIQGKLPKYTGYMSEYGLSREQLQQRDQKLQKKQRFLLQQTLKTNEQEMQKMQDNERAFTTWLRNKMRFPINKTRNMFDVKFGISAKTKSALRTVLTNNSRNGDSLSCTPKLKEK